jgi:hypothetical protein
MLKQLSSQDCKAPVRRIQLMISINIANAKPSQHQSCVGDAEESVWSAPRGGGRGCGTEQGLGLGLGLSSLLMLKVAEADRNA